MHVLMIGHDATALDMTSKTAERMRAIGARLGELSIITLSRRSAAYPKAIALAETVRARGTASRFRFLYVRDAVRLGKTFPKPDLITAQDVECGMAAEQLARHFGVPFELQFHTDVFSPEFARHAFLNRLRIHVARKLLPKAASVRAVSERVKRHILKTGIPLAREPYVLPVYVDLAAFAAAAPAFVLHEKHPHFNFIVVVVARLVREKDLPLALEAFRLLHAKNPRAGLIIVGEGPERSRLHTLIQRRGLTAAVVLAGAQDDVVSYLKGADALMLTSRYEGLGRVLLEAAAVGVPIVTTDVGAAGEWLQHERSTLVCPVGDAACLAEALVRLQNNNQLRIQLRRQAKEDVLARAEDFPSYLARMQEGFARCLAKE